MAVLRVRAPKECFLSGCHDNSIAEQMEVGFKIECVVKEPSEVYDKISFHLLIANDLRCYDLLQSSQIQGAMFVHGITSSRWKGFRFISKVLS